MGGMMSPEQVLVVLHSCSEPCKFSEQEVRALIGEIKVNDSVECEYKDFVKTWVPIIFECRERKTMNLEWKSGAVEPGELDDEVSALPRCGSGSTLGSRLKEAVSRRRQRLKETE